MIVLFLELDEISLVDAGLGLLEKAFQEKDKPEYELYVQGVRKKIQETTERALELRKEDMKGPNIVGE